MPQNRSGEAGIATALPIRPGLLAFRCFLAKFHPQIFAAKRAHKCQHRLRAPLSVPVHLVNSRFIEEMQGVCAPSVLGGAHTSTSFLLKQIYLVLCRTLEQTLELLAVRKRRYRIIPFGCNRTFVKKRLVELSRNAEKAHRLTGRQ